MASATVTGELIEIRLTEWERRWIGRERLAIPVASVRHAAAVDNPLRLARGARRGLAISGFVKIGIWGLFGGPRQLVSARRGEPGLHLVLDRTAGGGEFDEIVLSDPDAAGIADTIARATAARR
ncbi:hypothetical protein GCM10010399_89670 [Dactylosporangium fulvum]|uniref:Bacterial Pleckstrin homology domain-containing protein n=1 Tax=Dactylosporangium fulvum TaxID=53359 RepID=A0ABY5W7Y6_9ACTN|nr:hypothetical protein [Dactylosporangium fulvum]UWP85339.1 hypothetical protein Dfulv_14330 [Dactylosporangium fulvum]